MKSKKVKGTLFDSFGLEGKLDIYFNLQNQNFSDEFNSYKNWKVEGTYYIDDSHKLHFGWTICKVKVERCKMKMERWLMFREYGCRGSYGFVVLDTYDGDNMNIMQIDCEGGYYKVNTNELLGYEMTNLKLCEDYYRLLSSIKNGKINKY